jgi:predicted nucleic acid-binding protein
MKCIDSSAIVKYLSREEGWEALRDDLLDSTTIELAVKELSNAFWVKVRKKDVEFKDALHIISEFNNNAVLVSQSEFLPTAFKISVEHGITVYDSLFIAVAVVKECELVTCDAKQAEVAKKVGVAVKFYK